MSGIGWQDVVSALLVVCALGYLVRRKLRTRKSAAACPNCPGCETVPAAPAAQALVTLGRAPRRHPGP